MVVSIFLNPTQFHAPSDLENYPSSLDADLRLCTHEHVDLVFAPSTDDMYPKNSATTVHVKKLTDHLCGRFRPGHFDGVATVVSKLFHLVPAQRSYFGEKDYQQLAMVKQMVRDLNLPIDIIACPTVRAEDGLALSSRNALLSPDERLQARSLCEALRWAVSAIRTGERKCKNLTAVMRERILAAGPAEIDYIEVVDTGSLEPLDIVIDSARICLAVHIGTCRLIDNMAVDLHAVGA